jgi:hypothetical protein
MTFDLTLTTNAAALTAAGFTIALIVMTWVGARIAYNIRELAYDMKRKDFSFKPRYDEQTGTLKINPLPYWL